MRYGCWKEDRKRKVPECRGCRDRMNRKAEIRGHSKFNLNTMAVFVGQGVK